MPRSVTAGKRHKTTACSPLLVPSYGPKEHDGVTLQKVQPVESGRCLDMRPPRNIPCTSLCSMIEEENQCD